jgi:hypothetical protein
MSFDLSHISSRIILSGVGGGGIGAALWARYI